MQRRRVVVAWMVALLAGVSTVAPSAAATSYSASFSQERTVQRGDCPQGIPPPPSSFCFTGSDHSHTGTSTPPVPTDQQAIEDFEGFVDFTQTRVCPDGTTGFPDHNTVTISTYAGQLFLTTDGVDCPSTGTDDGVWNAQGGTGIFKGASGTGTVHTQATGGTGTRTDPIRSFSSYTGSLTLR
jgi:hypothetical protein